MRQEAMTPKAYVDVIMEHGAPNKSIMDNTQILTGTHWTTINR